MQIDAYFDRIGYDGDPGPDRETLFELHRRHLLAIPYENLDVQLRRPVGFDLETIYGKIVRSGRGGWCFEMNGLFGWALGEIGFDVRRMAGGVAREHIGDRSLGGHLVLSIDLDGRTWIADVGFGDGVFEPIPLLEGTIEQRGFVFDMGRDGEYWRFRNHQFGGAPSFDFRHEPADEAMFAEQCEFLQTDDRSPFRSWLVVQRFVEDGYEIQQGLTARHITAAGKTEWVMESSDQLLERLHDRFGLDVPEVATLWPDLERRHEAFLAAQATEAG